MNPLFLYLNNKYFNINEETDIYVYKGSEFHQNIFNVMKGIVIIKLPLSLSENMDIFK
jgi:hypothetical protein